MSNFFRVNPQIFKRLRRDYYRLSLDTLDTLVWNLTSQMRAQLEMAIGQGLSKGKSAQNLSREVRQCLKEPDMMYRRYHMNKVLADGRKKKITEWRRKVVDENGKVRFVKQPLEQTGRGVYRSSYKNAMRLTRTEINLAYHYADWEYWNSSNTVIGIMVSLSNNHTLNGKPFVDICDRFGKQRFPKWFKFTGWHPQCRCIATPISPNRKELIEYLKKVRDGEDVSNFHFTGEVTELPATFTDWMKENAERLQFMQAKGRLPYFIKENFIPNNTDNEMKGIFRASMKKNLQEWDDDAEQKATPLTNAQKENLKEIANILGTSVGERMNFNDANNMHSNPKYRTIFDQKYLGNSYSENCTLCVMSHELRMRGLDVEAKPMNMFSNSMKLIRTNPEKLWLDPKTLKHPKWTPVNEKNIKITKKQFERSTSKVGRYHVKLYWSEGGGHVFCVDRLPNGELRFYDPQNGDLNWGNWLEEVNINKTIGILKVDELLIDTKNITSVVSA